MEPLLCVKAPFLAVNSKLITNHRQRVDVSILNLSSARCYHTKGLLRRVSHKYVASISAVSAELGNGVLSQSEDFSFATISTNDSKELKVSVKVSGAIIQSIYDDVFSKMVAAAQPIPGFRRVKGAQDVSNTVIGSIVKLNWGHENGAGGVGLHFLGSASYSPWRVVRPIEDAFKKLKSQNV